MMKRLAIIGMGIALMAASTVPSKFAVLRIAAGELGSARIFVPCSFDGISRECFIDTGSNDSSVLGDNDFASYGAKSSRENMGTTAKAVREDIIKIKELKVGERRWVDIAVTRRDPALKKKADVVGADLFAGTSAAFLFKTRRLLFDAPELPTTAQKLELLAGLVPAIAITVGQSTTTAVWDTGAELTVLDRKIVDAPSNQCTRVTKDNATDSSGSSAEVEIFRCKVVRAGGVTFEQVHAVAMDFDKLRHLFGPSVNAILGSNLLSTADWYLDFKNKRWSIATN